MDKTLRQINEETEDFNNTINKLDLIDIENSQPNNSKLCFSSAQGMLSRPYIRP